jgi:hypothetical protein
MVSKKGQEKMISWSARLFVFIGTEAANASKKAPGPKLR